MSVSRSTQMAGTTRREFLKSTSLAAAAGLASGAVAGRRSAAQTTARPNVLFLFPDQHRPDWMFTHPEIPVPMPNLERLAQRGTTFQTAYCAAPVCAPSRACLASGKEYDRCGVPSNQDNYPLSQTTFYERLRDESYHVLGTGKLDLATGELVEGVGLGEHGQRFVHEWGFSEAINNAGKQAGAHIYYSEPVGPKDAYYTYLDALDPALGPVCADDYRSRRTRPACWGDTRPSPLPEAHYCDNWLARNGFELLDQVPRGEPWFLMVNFVGPHCPMDIPERLERLYRGPERHIDGFPQPHAYEGPFDPAHHVRIRQNYAAMIENVDAWLGRYLEVLEQRGELDNTLIVYASDHGEMLGDHSRWGKQLPYEASAGVPLVIAGPGVRAGVRSSALVSLIDLSATFLDYAEAPIPDDMDGFSLRALLAGETESHREYVLSGLYDWRMVTDGRYKYIRSFEGHEELLFDLEEDPAEDIDLASRDPERCRRLRRMLEAGSYRPVVLSRA